MSTSDRYWAVATAVNKRSKRRYLFEDTIRATRRDAIRAYEMGLPAGGFKTDREDHGVEAIRVTVTIDHPRGETDARASTGGDHG